MGLKKEESKKKPSDSAVTMTELVLPFHANALGTIFGGTVMSWIDIAGAIAASRHARQIVVTASVDALHFNAPIKVGQMVQIMASVNYTGRSSMEVGVRVDSEDPLTGVRQHNVRAYATFVALDQKGKPVSVPQIDPQTPEEKRRYEQAKKRRESRIKLAEELKKED